MVSLDRKHAQRAALASLVAAGGLVAAKLAAGIASGSLSLLSEAAHSALDAGATALTWFAIRIASRPPDEEHTYGHGRAENISALLETMGLFALSIYIAVRAIGRLGGGSEVQVEATWYAYAVIILSIVVDFSRARLLSKLGRRYRSPALQADALHFTADLLTSTIVLVGLVLVGLGYPSADAIGSLLIAGYVAYLSARLGMKSIDVLMDRAPAQMLHQIEQAVGSIDGVEEVRRVRLRYAGGVPQADVVVGVSRSAPLERAHDATEQIEAAIESLAPGADVVVHVEPLANEVHIAEVVKMIAAREPSVSEIHNVAVTSSDSGLQISLHARFPADMQLGEAHEIVERMESEIARQITGVDRVDTHMEPLESQTAGADVTSDQATLVAWAKALAEQQSQVRDCHEVVITEASGELSVVMHCEAEPGLSIEAVHQASTHIEQEVHRRWLEVRRVTVHFEPAGAGNG